MEKQTIPIKGMHCASCANVIGRTLRKTAGVFSCEVNYATEKAEIEFDKNITSLPELENRIRPLGYNFISNQHQHVMSDGSVMSGMDHSAHLGLDQTDLEKQQELKSFKTKLEFVLPLAALVFVLMLWETLAVQLFNLPALPVPMNFYNQFLFVASVPALFWIGLPYLRGLWNFIRYGAANMDTLIGLGTTVAFCYSAILILLPQFLQKFNLPQQTFFDVVIVVIGFITLGKYLEARSKLKTGQALEKLINLQAKTALIKVGSEEKELSVEQVKIGDLIIVKPGTKIPVDGVIVEGASSVDEAMITGEAMPVDKHVNDSVVAGTINKQGFFIFKASKVGSETLLAHIIKMVEAAQGSRAPIQKLADKISAIFVPVVLGIALVSLLVWVFLAPNFMPFHQAVSLGLLSFVSVLIIACPCALGLATPTAIIVGVGKGAANGILVKNAESMEKLHCINVLVVDKTGTLTLGKPTVTDVAAIGRASEIEILQLAASLEAKSEHPLAESIVSKAKEKNIEFLNVSNFKNLEGQGIRGTINQTDYFIGSPKLMTENGINLPEIEKFTSQGKTPVFLARVGALLGIFAIADVVKPEAIATIKELHKLGIEVVMLTGDDQKAAEYIGKQIGIDKIFARLLPNEKAEKIQELQAQGKVVAMAGDGINDAPALATANVGIAMGTGTDVAIESADLTLLRGDIAKILSAINLSKATLRTVKQNLFWAFIYNIVGIPLAAGLFYPIFGWRLDPAFAGMAMALSSVSVVLNSLRLKRAII